MALEKASKRLKTWSEDKQKVVYFNKERNPVTLDLLGSSPKNSPSSSFSCGLESIQLESIEGDLLNLGPSQCLHPDIDKCLDLKAGAAYYLNSVEGAGASSMNYQRKKRLGLNSSEEEDKRLDLKLNLSTTHSSKCGSESSGNYMNNCSSDSIASEVESGMRLVGCVRCLMYYMVSRRDDSCPKCKGSFLLNFLDGDLSSP